MADLVHRYGLKALIDHLVDSTVTLQNTTNCLFAVLVQASYTPLEADADMTAVTGSAHEWDGVADHGMGTGADALEIAVANVSTAIDADGHIRLILPNLDFGAVTTAGSPVKYCSIYVETSTAAADSARFPLLTLTEPTAKQPVVGQNFTWITNPNGTLLLNLNP